MLTQLKKLKEGNWLNQNCNIQIKNDEVDLVLCFGEKNALKKNKPFLNLSIDYPNADIVICSTAGEILQNYVYDDSVICCAIKFEKTDLRCVSTNINDHKNGYEAGKYIANQLVGEKLSNILVFSDGSLVNGSELVKGLSTSNVLVTGGLAGDGPDFVSTLVGLNQNPAEGIIVGVGFYGDHLSVSHGSQGGWESFGLERIVTKSEDNKLYEIDGENALNLYKKYLGDAAKELPGAALLYPLSVTIPGSDFPIVRTILSINENENSMVFAGDVPVGSKVRLMRANFEKLTMAASNAAKMTFKQGNLTENSLSLLISCVGRKLVLGTRVDEEVEAVRRTLGPNVPIIGFYSYGEISPFNDGGGCQLHNQTMTITTFHEIQ